MLRLRPGELKREAEAFADYALVHRARPDVARYHESAPEWKLAVESLNNPLLIDFARAEERDQRRELLNVLRRVRADWLEMQGRPT